MSEHKNAMRVDEKIIKNVLRHHDELLRQTYEQMIDVRKKIDEITRQSIEIASYPKIDLSIESNRGGEHRDLFDVYLKYQKLIRIQKEELINEMHVLTIQAEGIHRIYLCFQILPRVEYRIINRIYVKGELYKTVEEDFGLNHRIFEQKRQQAIQIIQNVYKSDLSNEQIVYLCKGNSIIQKERDL